MLQVIDIVHNVTFPTSDLYPEQSERLINYSLLYFFVV